MTGPETKARIRQVLVGAWILGYLAAAFSHYALLSSEVRHWSDLSLDPHGGGSFFFSIVLFVLIPLGIPIMCAVGLGLSLLSRAGRATWDSLIMTIAIAITVAGLLTFLVFLIAPSVLWQILPGVTLMTELTDLLGVTQRVSNWIYVVASLVITMAAPVFLFANAGPFSGSNDGPSEPSGNLN